MANGIKRRAPQVGGADAGAPVSASRTRPRSSKGGACGAWSLSFVVIGELARGRVWLTGAGGMARRHKERTA